jgi:uncharacterized RDD family membrane protein YckC
MSCLHQNIDNVKGLLCRITHDAPNFIAECTTYHEDKFLKRKYELHEVARCQHYHQASKGQRIINGLVDWGFAFLFFVLTINLFNIGISESNQSPQHIILKFTLAFLSVIFYYSIMEAIIGRTFGKMITGTRVVSENGERPSFLCLLKRSALRILPFDCVSFLYWKYDGWHDRWTNTRVVVG